MSCLFAKQGLAQLDSGLQGRCLPLDETVRRESGDIAPPCGRCGAHSSYSGTHRLYRRQDALLEARNMEARSPEKLVNVSNEKVSVTEHDDQSKHQDYEIAIWDLSCRQRVRVSVCHPGTGAQCVLLHSWLGDEHVFIIGE